MKFNKPSTKRQRKYDNLQFSSQYVFNSLLSQTNNNALSNKESATDNKKIEPSGVT